MQRRSSQPAGRLSVAARADSRRKRTAQGLGVRFLGAHLNNERVEALRLSVRRRSASPRRVNTGGLRNCTVGRGTGGPRPGCASDQAQGLRQPQPGLRLRPQPDCVSTRVANRKPERSPDHNVLKIQAIAALSVPPGRRLSGRRRLRGLSAQIQVSIQTLRRLG